MPRYSTSGVLAAGFGGDGHYLSINGQQMFRSPSQCIEWLNDAEVVTAGGDYARIVAVRADGPPDNERLLYQGPSLATRCGGNRWAVRIPNGPWRLDDGSDVVEAVEHFGRDGSLVTWVWEGGGLKVRGRVIEPTDLCTGIQVFSADVLLYQARGAVQVVGMPMPRLLPGVAQHLRVCQHKGSWWAIYQSTFNDRLVCHPFDGPERGYILNGVWGTPEGFAYRPDLCSVDGRLRACWAVVESEFPHQVREVLDLESLPVVNLLASDPIEIPDDPDEPEEPSVIPNLTDRVIARWNARGLSDFQKRAYAQGGKGLIQLGQAHFTRDFALEIRPELLAQGIKTDLEFYHNPIPGTSYQVSPDILLLTTSDGVVHSIKVVGSDHATDEAMGAPKWTFGQPAWFEQGPPNPADRRDPASVDLGPSPLTAGDDGDHGDEDDTPPASDLQQLRASVSELTQRLDAIQADLAELEQVMVDAAKAANDRLTTLENTAVTLPKLRARGRASVSWSGVSIDVPVVPE